MMRILVIEDEKLQAVSLKRGLEEAGYAVDVASTGEEGESLAFSIPFDLIILDLVLPGKDGLEVCSTLRQRKISTPILMLTRKNDVRDRIKGLDQGADDYLGKPFHFEELLARVRALLRRESATISPRLTTGDLAMDTVTQQVWLKNQEITLTGKEFAILEYLMRHPDAVVTRSMLEQHVWNLELDSTTNLIEAYICRLRAKLGQDASGSIIQTIKGRGYRLISHEIPEEH